MVECLTWDLCVTGSRLTRGTVGAWWFCGRVLDSRLRGYQFEPTGGLSARHFIRCIVLDQTQEERERSGSVVECLTRDRRAAGSSLTGVTALWSLSKTHLS